jgi:ubiquinone/menaquinone biosynthesis C-methylase UbiE
VKLPFLRKSSSESLSVSMAGLKLGDRLLIVGCSDPRLIAQLAVKTGLTGRAHAVDPRGQVVEKAAAMALREGALVETSVSSLAALPFEAASFDVAVVRDALMDVPGETRPAVLAEVRRVLRPGGRCLVIDAARRAGIDYVTLFDSAGFKAARVLAERGRQVFAEAVNPITNQES